MVTARKLRHHTAVLGMNVDLGIQCVRHQSPLGVIQRHPGLIAAGFYAQYLHDIALYRITSGSINHSSPTYWPFAGGAGYLHSHLPMNLTPNAFIGTKKGAKTNTSQHFAKQELRAYTARPQSGTPPFCRVF